MSQTRNVVIVGMARSGTSMTAALFRKAGYFVAWEEATETQAADHLNPSGYWEAGELLQANRDVLRRSGFARDNTWMFDAISDECASAIHGLSIEPHHRDLVQRYNRCQPWLWKDPRLCFTLPYWWRILDPSSTSVLVLVRSEDEIVRSFRRVGWRADSDVGRLRRCIRQHIQTARRTIERYKIPSIEVSYSDFAEAPDRVVDVLCREFGVALRREDLGYRSRHNSSSPQGRLRAAIERLADRCPPAVRHGLKRTLPRQLGRWLSS